MLFVCETFAMLLKEKVQSFNTKVSNLILEMNFCVIQKKVIEKNSYYCLL